jgi:uncharacterized membrane protein YgcG
MEVFKDMNELLTTKMCSPVIVYGVVLVVSVISVYLCRERLKRYNTGKMDTLATMFTMQEVKFMLVLGVVMFGLCQYNKSELAWIFLIFPIIYVMIQNILLYIHVSSAVQSAPQAPAAAQESQYGYGMNAPLLGASQGPSLPADTQQVKVPPVMSQPREEYTLPKITSQSTSMGGGFGSSGSGFGGAGSSMGPSGFNL